MRSTAPSGDPTGGLRAYPKDLLSSPLTERTATFGVRPGAGTLTAPGPRRPADDDRPLAGDGFAGVFADAAAGQGVLLLLLLAAFAWGAVHALSPGHGKTMVAAYLVGTRGTARHAVALGATVTVTHTLGVFALGLVALALPAVHPARAALPVAEPGLGPARARGRRQRAALARARARAHAHAPPPRPRPRPRRTTTGMTMVTPTTTITPTCVRARCWRWARRPGSSPARRRSWCCSARWPSTRSAWAWCSSSRSRAGLAATLTGLGLLVVAAGASPRASAAPRAGRVLAVLPALSALAIVAVGLALTAQAVPKVL